MKELTTFIEKLNKLTFIAKDGNTLISEEGFEVSYSAEIQSLYGDGKGGSYFSGYMPIQLVVRVRKNNKGISFWGCTDAEETLVLAKWFAESSIKARGFQDEIKQEQRSNAEAEWNKL